MRAIATIACITGLALTLVTGGYAPAAASKVDRGTWQGLQYQRAEVCWAIYAIHPDVEQAGDKATMERIISADPAFARTAGAAGHSADDLDKNRIVAAALGDIYYAIRDLTTNQVDLDRALAGCEDLKRDFRARLGPLGLGTP